MIVALVATLEAITMPGLSSRQATFGNAVEMSLNIPDE